MSSIDATLSAPLKPYYRPLPSDTESESAQAYISALSLLQHPEGGYFAETDRNSLRVPNPFLDKALPANGTGPRSGEKDSDDDSDNVTRSASTTIYYYITPGSPIGVFHRNKGRTVHTLHRGRGRYVLIHADGVNSTNGASGKKAKVETFVVGHDLAKGEKLQWIVEGGKFKATYLLPDEEGGQDSDGLLISETVVPGFEFKDHDFASREDLHNLVTAEQEAELEWLLRGSPEAQRQKSKS